MLVNLLTHCLVQITSQIENLKMRIDQLEKKVSEVEDEKKHAKANLNCTSS